jgi:glutamyl/glutaminyl-tRNA synthetase
MSSSGALFDMDKLNDISKDVLFRIPAEQLYDFLKDWAGECEPDILSIFDDKEYMVKILDLGRAGKKPRKDLIYARQIIGYISYFFDDLYEREDAYPEEVPEEDVRRILKDYLETYNHEDDQTEWFSKIRKIAEDLGYAPRPKDYKKNPDLYKGHVGHVSTVIRIALMGRAVSPDIREIQQIMGENMMRRRIENAIEGL